MNYSYIVNTLYKNVDYNSLLYEYALIFPFYKKNLNDYSINSFYAMLNLQSCIRFKINNSYKEFFLKDYSLTIGEKPALSDQ